MIFVLETHSRTKVESWFAYDNADFARKVYATDSKPEWAIFDVSTPRELLDLADKTPESPNVREDMPAICALGDEHGWDTPLFRADYLQEPGTYTATPITEPDACLAALNQRYERCQVFWSEKLALDALNDDKYLHSREGYRAYDALREQLMALEVLQEGGAQ